MADFEETMYVSSEEDGFYSYAWIQVDLATGDEIDFDYEECCSREGLIEGLIAHGFLRGGILDYLDEAPHCKLVLRDEY